MTPESAAGDIYIYTTMRFSTLAAAPECIRRTIYALVRRDRKNVLYLPITICTYVIYHTNYYNTTNAYHNTYNVLRSEKLLHRNGHYILLNICVSLRLYYYCIVYYIRACNNNSLNGRGNKNIRRVKY